jgi:hypothetical protein
MKKLALLFTFSLFLFSCEKDNYLVPKKEVPDWLKTKISQAEKLIKEDPNGLIAYAAWIRYKWQNEYYYELHNYLSSTSPVAISSTQDTLRLNPYDTTTDYYKEKCCKQFIWKGPKYTEPSIK